MRFLKLSPCVGNRYNRLLVFSLCLILFSCQKTHEGNIAANPEIKAFVAYFFVPGSTLTGGQSHFSLPDQPAQDLLSTDGLCSSDTPCNRTKEYFLAFTPNFLFETINGRTTVSEADPDSFVDIGDIREKKVYRVSQTGTDGSLYGAFWISDFSFVVYGMESGDGFVEVYDIKAKTKTGYTIDRSKRKRDADVDAFLIARYGQDKSFTMQR